MNWGYVAGFFDGEGSTGFHRLHRHHSITFSNTNLNALSGIRDFIGAGTIRPGQMSKFSKKPCFNLRLQRAKDIHSVIVEMFPYLCVKRKQVSRLLEAMGSPVNNGLINVQYIDRSYVSGFFDAEGSVARKTTALKRTSRLAFYNTDLTALTRIRDFIKCGKIFVCKRNERTRKQLYCLRITRYDGKLEIAKWLLRNCLIKNMSLTLLIDSLLHNTRIPLSDMYRDRVCNLYKQGFSIREVAQHLGVPKWKVWHFMNRNRIPRRHLLSELSAETKA